MKLIYVFIHLYGFHNETILILGIHYKTINLQLKTSIVQYMPRQYNYVFKMRKHAKIRYIQNKTNPV